MTEAIESLRRERDKALADLEDLKNRKMIRLSARARESLRFAIKVLEFDSTQEGADLHEQEYKDAIGLLEFFFGEGEDL